MEYMKKKKIKIALAQIKIEQKNIEKNCKKIFPRRNRRHPGCPRC